MVRSLYQGRRKPVAGERAHAGGQAAKAERNAALIADYLAGVGTPTLAKRYGVSTGRAYEIICNAGIVPRARSGDKRWQVTR